MTFSSRIRALGDETVLIETPSETLRAGDLSCGTDGLSGCSVLLASDDLVEAVRAIARLDGHARQMGFCSPSFPDEAKRGIVVSGGFDAMLGTGEAGIPAFTESRSLVRFLADEASDGPPSGSASGPSSGTAWVMTTSGTTGAPKLVAHSLDSLTVSTRTGREPMQHVRWGLLYDFTRFAGMQVLLQSVLSGAVLVAPGAAMAVNERVDFFRDRGVTHVSATPTLWRKILMTPDHEKIPLKVATLGGEIADQAVLDALRSSYPESEIIHIFASTEAGVGFSVRDGRAGFPLSYLDRTPKGTRLRVRDGVLELRNARVGRRYVGTDTEISDVDGWVSTGDLVEVSADRVRFLGRANGTINVGGNKVLPEFVESALLAHPAIALARAYGRKNPLSGALVAADVVPAREVPDEKAFVREVRGFLDGILEPHQVPAVIKLVPELSTNAAGKVARGGA